MSESIVETVKIVSEKSDSNPHGYVVINAEDFDSSIHVLLDGENVVNAESNTEDAPAKRGRKPKNAS